MEGLAMDHDLVPTPHIVYGVYKLLRSRIDPNPVPRIEAHIPVEQLFVGTFFTHQPP